jgi:hypothetical protein
MKPRARRVTIAAAVLGVGVLAVLVVVHWGTVREHVEAWHFQLTRETETIESDVLRRISPDELLRLQWDELQLAVSVKQYQTGLFYLPPKTLFSLLADFSGHPVSFDPRAVDHLQHRQLSKCMLEDRLHCADVLRILEDNRWRILDQRFPRRAYVVIRDNP